MAKKANRRSKYKRKDLTSKRKAKRRIIKKGGKL